MSRTRTILMVATIVQLMVACVSCWNTPARTNPPCRTTLLPNYDNPNSKTATWAILPTKRGTTSSSTTNYGNDPSYFIRTCLVADVGRISTILADGFFKHKTNFITYQWERFKTYLSLESTFPEDNEPYQIFVACDAFTGVVLGCVEVDCRYDELAKRISGFATNGNSQLETIAEEDPNAKKRMLYPYMCNLAVDEDYRGQGIASALVQQCEAFVQQCHLNSKQTIPNKISLRVRQSTPDALYLYDKLGYRSYLQYTDDNGEVIIAMSKTLS